MRFFGFEITRKKRQVSALGEVSEWIPFSNNFPPTQATRLATVGRCLRLYSDFLLQCPLIANGRDSHYLIDILESPCKFMSKKNFYEALTFELLLNGNFIAKVEYNARGEVTAILPYRAGGIYCYPTKGEYSDPISLQRGGYYYKDFKGRVFMPDEIFHLRDLLFNTSDQLNGLSRVYLYEILFQAGYSIQAVQQSLSASGLRPSQVLNYPSEIDSKNLKKVKSNLARFFSGSSQSLNNSVLTLPEGFELKQLMLNSPEKAMEFLASKSDLDISRIFGIPIELLARSDAKAGGSGANHLKEAHRFFLRTTLKSFLKNISDSLSALAMDGTQFKFKVDSLRASDLREQSQWANQLVSSGVLSKEEAKKALGVGE